MCVYVGVCVFRSTGNPAWTMELASQVEILAERVCGYFMLIHLGNAGIPTTNNTVGQTELSSIGRINQDSNLQVKYIPPVS